MTPIESHAETPALLVLHDPAELRFVQQVAPAALASNVLAFDADVHLELKRIGLAHRTPWDFVRDDEWSAAVEVEQRAWRTWQTLGRLPCDGLDLLQLAAFRHVSWIARLSWAAYALDRVLEETQAQRAITLRYAPAHGLDQPPHVRQFPLLQGILHGLAEQRGLSVQSIDATRQELNAAARPAPRPARDPRLAATIDPVAALPNRPYILLYGNGAEVERQWPLAAALQASGRLAVLQVCKHAPEVALARFRAAGCFTASEAQLLGDEVGVTLGDAPARALQRLRMQPPRDRVMRSIFANPHIRSHFEFLFGFYAERMACLVRAWRRLLSARPPAAVVTSYQCPLLDVACALRIPTLVLPHGLMVIGQPRQFTSLPSAAHIAAISARHADALANHGIADERIHVTGDPWASAVAAHEVDRDPHTIAQTRAALGVARQQRVVLLCTGSYGMACKLVALPYVNWPRALRSTAQLASISRGRPEWVFALKCHPRFDYPALYAEINANLPAESRWRDATGQRLAALVAASDAVVVVNSLTSALVEASLLKRPVLTYFPGLNWYDPREWACDAWPNFTSPAELQTELERLFSDPRHYADRTAQTRAAAHVFLGDRADESAQRAAECILRLCDRPRPGASIRTAVSLGI